MVFEDRQEAAELLLDEAKGIALLKLSKRIQRMQYMLDWQGANPKELDLDELAGVIREPHHEDSIEDLYRAKINNHKTAIRAYCVNCQGGSVSGVKDCAAVTCPLFSFRMGKDHFRGFALPKVEEVVTDADLTEDDDFETDEDDEEDDSDED